MIQIEFINQPDACDIEAILAIYHRQGWWPQSVTDPSRVLKAIAGSHCYVIARDSGTIVGIGRAISDGIGDAYLHDITVIPAYRKQGIATEIVRMIVNRLHRDGITWIGLIAEKGSTALYKKNGFTPFEGCTPMFTFKKPDQDT